MIPHIDEFSAERKTDHATPQLAISFGTASRRLAGSEGLLAKAKYGTYRRSVERVRAPLKTTSKRQFARTFAADRCICYLNFHPPGAPHLTHSPESISAFLVWFGRFHISIILEIRLNSARESERVGS
jgi:hypothetical protein